uniref:Uncharacterized protein n=1 Tax=Cannabis sativa TaxID=3483 RepID=A0A803PEX1_CANSA
MTLPSYGIAGKLFPNPSRRGFFGDLLQNLISNIQYDYTISFARISFLSFQTLSHKEPFSLSNALYNLRWTSRALIFILYSPKSSALGPMSGGFRERGCPGAISRRLFDYPCLDQLMKVSELVFANSSLLGQMVFSEPREFDLITPMAKSDRFTEEMLADSAKESAWDVGGARLTVTANSSH